MAQDSDRTGASSCHAQARIVAWGGLDGGTVPNRAGNGPRDRRQAGIGGALPDKAIGPDRDGVAAALRLPSSHNRMAITAESQPSDASHGKA
jgi:hypothetical protein